MIKEFIKNSFIYTIGSILTRGISIILIPIYTRYLSPREYGIIDLFTILGAIISLTIALEIHQAVVRFYQDTQDETNKMQYVSTAFIFSLFVYSLYFIISYIFSDTFSILILDDIKYKNLFILASLAIATNGLFYFTSGQLRWQILPKESIIVSIFHIIIVASIAVYLLVGKTLKVESIFIGQVIGNICGSLLSIYFAKKSYQFVFNYKKLKTLIRFSYPLVFSGVSLFVSLYIDRIAIKELLGLKELGIYGLAYKFAGVTSLLMIAFQNSLSPLILKHYKEKDTPINIAKLFNVFILFSFFLMLATILFSKEIVSLMSTKEYYDAAVLIAPLVMAILFANMYIFAPGLILAKKTKTIASISISSAIINTLLNYNMIPIFGLVGAAYATMISSLIIFTIYVLISNKYYYINYKFNTKILLFVIILISANYINNIYQDINCNNIFLKFLSMILILIVTSYFIINTDDFYKLKST